jgi:hypothetical protein
MRCLLVATCLVACVKGNPLPDDTFVGTGGTLQIAGCGYGITTRLGAEPPRPALDAYGPDSTPRAVHLGVVGDPKTSMVVQWRTVDEVTRASTVRFGVGTGLTADQLTQSQTGVEFGFKGGGMTVFRQHQVHLCGLQPATTYSYQIAGVDPSHASPIYTFTTAPDIAANPDAEVVLGFVGDSRGGYDVWQQLIDQLLQRSPDIILFSGDAVTVGMTQNEWEDFFDRAEPLFANVPVVSANGNHEYNAVNYYSQLALPGDQEDFGVDYGYVHVTVGNDTPEDPSDLTGATRDAIAADFTASDAARWKVFMHHQPIWSASTRHGSSATLQMAWQPLIDQHHIDLVLNGHDHDYEVTRPMAGGTVQPSNASGTVYVVAGGAGAELYPNGSQFWTAYSESTYSAAILHVRRDLMTMDAFHPDGTPIPTGFSKSK